MTHDYRIDPDRIYVTGHSMGGRGALYFAYRLPSRFAAVIAVSPLSPITEWAGILAHVPLWLFHGTADTLAPVADTNELVQAIKAAGGHLRFDSLPGRDNFILDVYERPDIYQWLLQQKRSKQADSVRGTQSAFHPHAQRNASVAAMCVSNPDRSSLRING